MTKEKNLAGRLIRTMKRHPKMKASEAYRLMNPMRLATLLFLMGFFRRKEAKKAISNYITYQRHLTPSLKGSDLKELGYAEGPVYRRLLDRLLCARLDNEVDSREDELTFLKKHYPPGRYRDGGRPRSVSES